MEPVKVTNALSDAPPRQGLAASRATPSRNAAPSYVTPGRGTPDAIIASFSLYALSAVLACVAFYIAYQSFNAEYETPPFIAGSVVGGDAYNFILMAGRGMVWMGAAIVTAVIGGACHISGRLGQLRPEGSR